MLSVKDTYNSISKEFDKSRFSVWKGVREFLDDLPSKSTLCEVGCGNGKNLIYRNDLITKGYDISTEMVKICLNKNLDVEQDDITDLKIDDESFDNVISIAVIHHLSIKELRVKAISELLRIVRPGGRVLIYVWAYEQPSDSRRKFNIGDNLVPFNNNKGETYYRFYHVYTESELEDEIKCVKEFSININKIYWEIGNWCAILTKL